MEELMNFETNVWANIYNLYHYGVLKKKDNDEDENTEAVTDEAFNEVCRILGYAPLVFGHEVETEEESKMPKYKVLFTKYYSYEVEAESDEEAFDLAYDDFCSDMQNPLAHTGYDECQVEEIEEEE